VGVGQHRHPRAMDDRHHEDSDANQDEENSERSSQLSRAASQDDREEAEKDADQDVAAIGNLDRVHDAYCPIRFTPIGS
jgi:hypothetical protein